MRRIRAGVLLSPLCALAFITSASAGGSWMLVEVGKQGAATPVSRHATLTDCLTEQKSREETQRAYLRAASEASPRDQLPVPPLAAAYRCLPDPTGPREPARQ